MNESDVHDVVRKVMALPLLPLTHIVPAFRELQQQQLQQQTSNPAVADVLSYVESTWLVNALWSPAMLSVYEQDIWTNNDL